jgi:hypothetical protein
MHERMRGDLQQQVQAGAEMIEKVPIPGLRPTVWDQTQQKVKYPKLLRKAVTDVVFVGSGNSWCHGSLQSCLRKARRWLFLKVEFEVKVIEMMIRFGSRLDIFLKQILSCNKDCRRGGKWCFRWRIDRQNLSTYNALVR